MALHPAYYNVIRFCPERPRTEVGIIDALLPCPELNLAEAATWPLKTTDRESELEILFTELV